MQLTFSGQLKQFLRVMPGAPGPDFRTWDTTNLNPLSFLYKIMQKIITRSCILWKKRREV
jgi:hypothetical protein